MDQKQFDSSLEELSPEERLMLVSSKRQEPQGQEHTGHSANPCGGLSKSASRFKPVAKTRNLNPKQMTSQTQTQTQGGCSSEDSESSSCSSSSSSLCEGENDGRGKPGTRGQHYNPKKSACSVQHYHPRGNKSTNTNISTDSNSQSAYNTLIIHQNNSSLLADTWM